MKYVTKPLCFAVIHSLLVLMAGCQSQPRPRLRLGAYFGAPIGIAYPDPEHLGKHGYTNGWSEKIGLVYTCRGGFVDIGHLRDAADRTRYCTTITFEKLMNSETELTFRLLEPSVYIVNIRYPDNWDTLPEKEKIAQETALELGRYFAFTTMVWHEIITWYGYKYTGVFSEYISAFSGEDIYSDLVGVHVATKALQDQTNSIDDAMTMLIYKELEELDVQPQDVVKSAVQKIKGHWYGGSIYPFVSLKKRNLDIGIDDGFITPWLTPGACEDCEPKLYSVPNIDSLNKNGFSVSLEIEPKIMECDKLFKLIYPEGNGKFVRPHEHFPVIMKYIAEIEIERHGPETLMPDL